MRGNKVIFPLGARVAAFGGMIWLVVLAGNILNAFRLSIFALLFLLAPCVIVPLALSLVSATHTSAITSACSRTVRYLLFPGAALATISFFLREGWFAGAFTLPWLVVAAALAIDGLGRLIRTRFESFLEFCFGTGEGYTLVGAVWLLASRLGLQPVGFREPLVLLTAVHFHYAGLMAAVLAGLVISENGARQTPLALQIMLACAVLGPGLLGLAFLLGPKLKLAAVCLMVFGQCGIAVGTFRTALANAKEIGGRLLFAGGACVIAGMVLAAVWAVGEYPLHAFVNLEQMGRYHGVLNSVGFGLCSLLGWKLLRGRPQGLRGPA